MPLPLDTLPLQGSGEIYWPGISPRIESVCLTSPWWILKMKIIRLTVYMRLVTYAQHTVLKNYFHVSLFWFRIRIIIRVIMIVENYQCHPWDPLRYKNGIVFCVVLFWLFTQFIIYQCIVQGCFIDTVIILLCLIALLQVKCTVKSLI